MLSFLVDLLIPLSLLVPLVGYSIAVRLVTRWNWEHLPFLSMGGILLVVYAGALGGVLQPTSIAVYWIGVVSGIGALVWGLTRGDRDGRDGTRGEIFKGIGEPAFVMPFALVVLAWLKLRGAIYLDWDEFSHWGLATKELLHHHHLVTVNSIQTVMDYPPGANLWQYFVASNSVNREDVILLANLSMILVPLGPLFRFQWRQWPKLLAAAFLSYFIFQVLGLGLRTIYVDHVMSAMFGLTLVHYFAAVASGQAWWFIAVPIAAMPLVKSFGVQLAAIIGAVIFCDLLIRSRRRIKWEAAFIAVLLMGAVASGASWKWHMKRAGLPNSVDFSSYTPANFIKELNPWTASERGRDIGKRFIHKLVNDATVQIFDPHIIANKIAYRIVGKIGLFPRASAFGIVLLYGVLAWLLVRRIPLASPPMTPSELPPPTLTSTLGQHKHRQEWWRVVSSTAILIAGFGAYAISLLLVFNLVLGIDGYHLMSFERYINFYLAGPAWLLFYWVLHAGSDRLLWGVVGGLAFFQTPDLSKLYEPLYTAERSKDRLEIQRLTDQVRKVAADTEGVYTIYQHTSGYPVVVARYELAPRPFNSGAWTLGPKWGDDDYYSNNISLEEWKKSLRLYKYLLLAHTDESFWKHYGAAFSPGDRELGRFLFRIVPVGEDVRLEPILGGAPDDI